MSRFTEESPPVAASPRSRLRQLPGLLPFALLAACAPVGPNHQAPSVPWSPTSWLIGHPAPPAQPKQPAPSTPTEAPVDPSWWALFHDDELSALEGRVATGNLDVQVAGTRLLESRAILGVSEAALLPAAEGTAAYSRQQLSKNGVLSLVNTTGASSTPAPNTNGAGNAENSIFQPFNVFQAGFDATWEIDFWGHARRGVESAEAASAAAREGERGVLLGAEAELARDYIQLRGVQRTIEITANNLQIAEKSQKLTQEKAEGGVTTDLDVANANALVATISSQLPTLEAQRDDLIDAIALLLGEPPQSLTGELLAGKPIPPVPPKVPIGLPSELARRRPDIRQAEAQLHEATADVGVAVADFYPRIVLSGSVALQATQLNHLGNWGNSNTWALGPTLSLPIFEGGRLRRTLELRKEQQQEAAIGYRRTVLTALHEVDTALTDYAAQQRRRDQLRLAVEANRKAVSLAQDRYTEGVADFLNVLDTQRDLLAVEQQYTQSTTEIGTDLVALYKALGGGWEAALPDVPPPEAPGFSIHNVLE
jgi:NodT family efflux transporter outer membrane factor (OMF) lipoprotein